MFLTIDNKKEYSDKFIEYLINCIQEKFLSDINGRKLIKIQNYINAIPKYKSLFIKNINCMYICIAGIYNLEIMKNSRKIIIRINPNVTFANTKINLLELCKLINNGTLQIEGYKIFNNTFNYFQNNINHYYMKFLFSKDKI